MTVRLTIEIDATSVADALDQLDMKRDRIAEATVDMTDPTPSVAAQEPRVEEPTVEPDAEVQVAKPEMIYQGLLDDGRKPAASSSTGDGVKIEVGSEVKDADGNVAVVHGLTRGKAVIEYEDGMGKLVDSSSLASVPYEDDTRGVEEPQEPTPAAKTEEPAPEPAKAEEAAPAAAPEVEDAEVVEGEPVTREMVRTAAQRVMRKVSSAKTSEVLREAGHGAQKIKEVPEDMLGDVLLGMHKALEEAGVPIEEDAA